MLLFTANAVDRVRLPGAPSNSNQRRVFCFFIFFPFPCALLFWPFLSFFGCRWLFFCLYRFGRLGRLDLLFFFLFLLFHRFLCSLPRGPLRLFSLFYFCCNKRVKYIDLFMCLCLLFLLVFTVETPLLADSDRKRAI